MQAGTPRALPLLAAFAVLLAAFAPTRAHARDDVATAQAKEHFKSGTRHYALAEYALALDDFKEAYRLRDDPAFLYNIAQCHRLLGNHDEAVRFYQTYLRQSPAAANRPDVEQLIAGEEKASALAKEKAARDEEARRREVELRLAAQPVARPWYRDPAGWALSATGLAFITAGAAVIGYTASLPVPRNATAATIQEYKNRQTISFIAGGVGAGLGAGLLVAGVVKLALHARPQRAALLVVPVEGGALVGAAGAF